VRLHNRTATDACAVQEHGVRANGRAIFDEDVINLEHAIFKRVCLEKCLHRDIVAEMKHVRINDV